MKKLSEKIHHIWSYAKEVLKSKDFEYIIWYKSNNGTGVFLCVTEDSWEANMVWGATVVKNIPYKEKIELADLMTGILYGVAYSIAEDRKKEKEKEEQT